MMMAMYEIVYMTSDGIGIALIWSMTEESARKIAGESKHTPSMIVLSVQLNREHA